MIHITIGAVAAVNLGENNGRFPAITAIIGLIKSYICSMAKQEKPKKERAKKYDEKLAIDGTFEDVIKVSLNYTPPDKEKPKKKAEKKK